MNFLVRPGAPFYREQQHTRALNTWRAAENRVAERWSAYVGAHREARRGAYTAYLMALDAEAAAASALERHELGEAA